MVKRFMERFDQGKELAPRDIVARAIDHEMKRLGEENVFLDISHRRPGIHRRTLPDHSCTAQSFGFDMTKEPLPVVPSCPLHLRRRDDRRERKNRYRLPSLCSG